MGPLPVERRNGEREKSGDAAETEDGMDTITGAIGWVFGTLFAILWWIAGTLFWIFFWLVLPVLIVGFLGLRGAEKVLGPDVVRAWVKSKTMKFGGGAWVRARRLTFALGVLPVRVLGWFVVYVVWHSLVSLLWRPKWQPWQRAWGKRWKPVKRTASGRVVKAGCKRRCIAPK